MKILKLNVLLVFVFCILYFFTPIFSKTDEVENLEKCNLKKSSQNYCWGNRTANFSEKQEKVVEKKVVEKKIVSKKIASNPIQNIIKEKAIKYNLNPQMFDELILCESSYNEKQNHDGGKGVGVAGWHKSTFNEVYAKYKKETGNVLNYSSSQDQLELMAWEFKRGEKYRLKWSSYLRYAKYGTCDVKKIRKITNNPTYAKRLGQI